MLDFYMLTPEEFEPICYDYICLIYKRDSAYKVEHTRYIHDGGRDIEITFYDELTYYKIWAECKQHKRNIGLDDIGKNVVLVISKHVNKVIFFSASDITESAKIEIMQIGEKLNFHVSFLCGEVLSDELSKYPDLIKEYFGIYPESIPVTSNKLKAYFFVSEFESTSMLTKSEDLTTIVMKNGDIFNLYIHICNRSKKYYNNIFVELISIPDSIRMQQSSAKYDLIEPFADHYVQFRGEIIDKQSSTVDLPQVLIQYECNEEVDHISLVLPKLDISKCKYYPLVGRKPIEFLHNDLPEAIEWCERGYPHVFDIRGVSGSGKSRLAEEIQKQSSCHGFRNIYLDSYDFVDYDIILRLLCEILHLPSFRGEINFSNESIRKLVITQGGSDFFADIIFHFLNSGKWDSGEVYHIVDTVVHFLLNPFREKGYCVIIDNIQELHPEILKFLKRLSELMTQKNGRVILIVITNTERPVAFSKKYINMLHTYLAESAEKKSHMFSQYICTPFEEEDATLFLMNILHIHSKTDPLLKKLLQKSGRLPFELIMTLEYLSDIGIIKWQNAQEWKIHNKEKFSSFLTEGFPAKKVLLYKRQEAWLQTHTKAENEAFTDLLSSVVSFEGNMPYAYYADSKLDLSLLDEMEHLLWLKDNALGSGVAFFHDNIKEFCYGQHQYRNNIKVLKHILNWLNQNPDIDVQHREKIIFSCYYRIGNFKEALEYGIHKIFSEEKSLPYSDILCISQILYNDPRTQKTPEYFVKVARIYAASIFSMDNKEAGCKVYSDVITYIEKAQFVTDWSEVCKLLHQAINSQLQSARYDTAIKWISMLEKMPNISDEYRYLAKNRYGVTYIALGQFKKAKEYLDESLQFAENTMNNLYWSSTSHSDLALYYFYNWHEYGRKEAAKLISKEFRMAISDYSAYGKPDISRDIEMEWHKAFLSILTGEYASAKENAEQCIELCNANHQAYGLSRGYNLKALAFLCDNALNESMLCLEEGLHVCELYSFPSGTFRMYNNMVVVAYLHGDFCTAKRYFAHAIESLEQQIEYKQLPVFTNLIATGVKLKDLDLIQKAYKYCNEISSSDLLNYIRFLQKNNSLDTVGANDGFAYFGFSGISYIF